jgi:hypothetical protein
LNTVYNYYLIQGVLPTAIIAGTFELSPEFWFDRNVLSRLLAVSLGAANVTYPLAYERNSSRKIVNDIHMKLCLTHLRLPYSVCSKQGAPLIPSIEYHKKWKTKWTAWKADICHRMTHDRSSKFMASWGFHDYVAKPVPAYFPITTSS